MTTPLARSVHEPKQAISRRLPKRRDDSGLTTLEWLLIVAAVAGLAALAVVLVQNVVGETSEQIAGSSARKTAATIAAQQVNVDAKRNGADQPSGAATYDKWGNYYSSKCRRLAITYGDAGITVHATFVTPAGSASVVAANVKVGSANNQTAVGTVANDATAHCSIS